MISLGIGWVPVWEVCAQAFTSLHFGTSVAATKTGRSVVSTDGPPRTCYHPRSKALALAAERRRPGGPRRPCESVHKTFPRKRRLLANGGSDGATHRAGASPRQMISIARSSVTGAAGMVAAA
jgi:hypothetical protein